MEFQVFLKINKVINNKGIVYKIKVFKISYQKVVQLLIIKLKIVHFRRPNFNMKKRKIKILISMILIFGKLLWKMCNHHCKNQLKN